MKSSYQNQQVMDPVADLLAGEHPVAYRVCFAKVCGGACPALLLSQMYYWSSTQTAKQRDGWFFMTQAQITEQTGLTIRETETARKRLREVGVLEESKRGLPMKLWFRVQKNALYSLLRAHAEALTNLLRNVEDDTDTPDPNLPQNVEDSIDESAAHLPQNVEDCIHISAPDLPRNVEDITESSSETPSETYAETTTTTQPCLAPETSVVVTHLNEEENSTLRLVEAITKSRTTALSIIKESGEEVVRKQALLWRSRSAAKNAKDPGAVFRSACRENWPDPEVNSGHLDRKAEKTASRRYISAPKSTTDQAKLSLLAGLSPMARLASLKG